MVGVDLNASDFFFSGTFSYLMFSHRMGLEVANKTNELHLFFVIKLL